MLAVNSIKERCVMKNKHHKKPRALRRLLRDRKGASAVEFAFVAPIFFVMMFTLFEIGWFYYTNSIVDASISNASRLIKTGRLQQAGLSDQQQEALIFTEVCRALKVINSCEENLTVEVETFSTFASLVSQTGNGDALCPTSSEADLEGQQFQPGGELSIVRIRVCYLHKILNPAIGIQLAEGTTNKRRIITSAVFRNEPYERNDS